MPTLRLVDLLREAAAARAADIYLVAGAVPMMNREGIYVPPQQAPNYRLTEADLTRFALEVMTEKQFAEFEKSREANLAFMEEQAGRFRVNVFYQRGSIGLVCRRVIMDIPTMRSLSLPPVVREVALADRGIVLVTGSTGSGKSTTLASMLDYRNAIRSGHIVTIEDPVEFIYRHRRSIVTQREVGLDTDSFHEALKNTLRQAPEVICIGELRDADTVQFAMHAAETGHLVFATLHSTNAVLAIERMLHFYPGEMKEQVLMQLSLNLKAVICQRLMKKIGGGRCAAHEILISTPRITDLITKGDNSSLKSAIAAENQDGIQNFDKSLYRLVKQGKITQDEAISGAESPNDLNMKFRGMGIASGSSWEDTSDPWSRIRADYEPPEGHPLAAKFSANPASYSNEDVPGGHPVTMTPARKPTNAPPMGMPPSPASPPPGTAIPAPSINPVQMMQGTPANVPNPMPRSMPPAMPSGQSPLPRPAVPQSSPGTPTSMPPRPPMSGPLPPGAMPKPSGLPPGMNPSPRPMIGTPIPAATAKPAGESVRPKIFHTPPPSDSLD